MAFSTAEAAEQPGLEQGDAGSQHGLVEVELRMVVRRRQIGPQNEVGGLTAVLLHPLDEKTGVLAGAETAGVDLCAAELGESLTKGMNGGTDLC